MDAFIFHSSFRAAFEVNHFAALMMCNISDISLSKGHILV